MYYNIFELYLGEGSLSLNPLVGCKYLANSQQTNTSNCITMKKYITEGTVSLQQILVNEQYTRIYAAISQSYLNI